MTSNSLRLQPNPNPSNTDFPAMSKTKTPSPKALKEAVIDKAATAFVFHPQNMSRALIRTRYIPCTDTKGSRVKAYTRSGRKGEPSLVISYDHGLNASGNHSKAAAALALFLGWVKEDGEKVLCGATGDDGTGSFVIINAVENANTHESQRANAGEGFAA